MKSFTVAMGMLCLLVTPAFGDAVNYTFEVVSGTMTVDLDPDYTVSPDLVTVPGAGTFGMTIYQQSETHVGASDTFVLGAADIYNAQDTQMWFMDLATASLGVGSARFLEFAPTGPAHIPPAGAAAIETDAYVELTFIFTGLLNTTLEKRAWAGEAMTFPVTITTSVQGSDIVTASLSAWFPTSIGITGISTTMTLDLRIDIVGTAHVAPDPALGGLTTLGIGGAAVWLRRRRQQ